MYKTYRVTFAHGDADVGQWGDGLKWVSVLSRAKSPPKVLPGARNVAAARVQINPRMLVWVSTTEVPA